MWNIVRGAIRWFSERLNAPPFVDCMPCSSMGVLRYTGVLVKDGDQFAIRAHIPGHPKGGLTFWQVFQGIQALWNAAHPGVPVPVIATTVDDAFILANLKVVGTARRNTTAFHVALDMGKVPAGTPLRRLTGPKYKGGHAIHIAAKSKDGTQLYIFNPMGHDAAHPPKHPPKGWVPYTGQLVPVADVMHAVQRGPSGKVKTIYGVFNAARKQ